MEQAIIAREELAGLLGAIENLLPPMLRFYENYYEENDHDLQQYYEDCAHYFVEKAFIALHWQSNDQMRFLFYWFSKHFNEEYKVDLDDYQINLIPITDLFIDIKEFLIICLSTLINAQALFEIANEYEKQLRNTINLKGG